MRTALILSDSQPDWISSQSIRLNLLKSYVQAFPGSQLIGYQADAIDGRAVLEKLKTLRTQRLVFLESNPNPNALLAAIGGRPSLDPHTEICFHIYGDFTLMTPEWKRTFEMLRGLKVRLLLASPAQRGMVREFFENSAKVSADLVPFPINDQFYKPVRSRQQVRAQLGLRPDETALLYSGRLSVQKGVPLLVQWLARFWRESNEPRFRLLIAGAYDELGNHLWGPPHPLGTSYATIQRELREAPLALQKRIQFLGYKNAAQLRVLYQASDIFVSLSTYHDEDFGMAPLEALFCGCSALLSTWGGYASLGLTESDVRFTEVHMDREGLRMSYSQFKSGLKKLIEENRENGDAGRRQRVQRYRSAFSIQACADRLVQIHSRPPLPLPVCHPLMTLHANRIVGMRSGVPPYKSPSRADRLYRTLYRHYLNSKT